MYKNNFIVTLKCNVGSILREKNDIISMPFGSEYSIVMRNLDSRKAVVSIEIDGENVLDYSKILINPYGETELTGFLKGSSVNNKFKFIKKTKEIVEHRGDKVCDGIVRVEVWFESKPFTYSTLVNYDTYWPHYTGKYVGNYGGLTDDSIRWRNYGGLTDDSIYEYNYHNTAYCSSVGSSSGAMQCSNDIIPTLKEDEGITVKGSKTKQDFDYVFTPTLELNSTVFNFKLKGTKINGSCVKNIVTMRKKIKCETCGKNCSSGYSFCPRCGTCLE